MYSCIVLSASEQVFDPDTQRIIDFTRHSKIVIQETHQMTTDKEAITSVKLCHLVI